MTLSDYLSLSKQIKIGKRLPDAVYLHVSCLSLLEPKLLELVKHSEKLAQLSADDYQIIKFSLSEAALSFLAYPDFFDNAFPELKASWRVNLENEQFAYRSYQQSINPPILHRKELLLPDNHPRLAEYQALTTMAESLGLFSDTKRIGFKQYWHDLIAQTGYQLIGQQFVPLANDDSLAVENENSSKEILRHKTALSRSGLSAPVQCLMRHELLTVEQSFFDYGCGRGDDLNNLAENDFKVAGWDPYYANENQLLAAEVVNLGFVINVIEDYDERVAALQNAYRLTEKVLAVSVMLHNAQSLKGCFYNDGVVTQRNTFQKYFTQDEIKSFVSECLGNEAIAIAAGIVFVFKDKDLEQQFLTRKQRNRSKVLHLRYRESLTPQQKASKLYETHKALLDDLWWQWLVLGREPDKSEVENLAEINAAFGSLRKALRFLLTQKDEALLKTAQQAKVDDLTVYFALNQFAKRKAYKHLNPSLQRDIKTFFGSYVQAQEQATALLFQLADKDKLYQACLKSSENGLGYLDEKQALQLHTDLVEQLPAILRVFIGCATVLYGDVENADLVKIHSQSSKLSLLSFDDFTQAVPKLLERVKINLITQEIDFFHYDGIHYQPPLLYLKSRYLNEESAQYAEQLAFDEALQALQLFNLQRYGDTRAAFYQTLEQHRWQIDDLNLIRSQTIPELDSPCGQYLRYRDLIECGQTQQATNIANLPQQADSYTALYELAINILDPVIDYFGMIELNYGFCGRELAKQIPKNIAPKLDQHAACELNTRGNLICPRLGAAIDFRVQDEAMREVADWVIENTPFDRLYFYGDDKPIHVSYCAIPKGEVVEMRVSKTGRRVPKVVRSLNND
ncbi:MAG: DNA phosphorothioation-associated putative methyltransferase [Methylococcaceae bacterium]|nr:DNA phosphorothioation-associated putative methyltransferase [Methylococcaceae bacterium]